MDLSDGLSLDLHRLCVASGSRRRWNACRGARIDEERALHGGEDYELVFTMPPRKTAPAGTSLIGSIVKGKNGAVEFQGQPLEPRGYNHF